MIRKAVVLFCALALLSWEARAQEPRSLVVLNFELEGMGSELELLKQQVPNALKQALSDDEVIQLVQLPDNLKEVEYRYDGVAVFDSFTINQLDLLGVDLALIGKIRQRAGEIWVNAKIVEVKLSEIKSIVEIKTSIQIGSGYQIIDKEGLDISIRIAVQMKELGSCLARQLVGEKVSCKFGPRLPKYTLVILNFEIKKRKSEFDRLGRDIPNALEVALFGHEQHDRYFHVVERKRLRDILKETDYQYDHKDIFADSTINKLKLLGANAALIGIIGPEEGNKVQVDIKIVEIETSLLIGRAIKIGNLRDIGEYYQMRELGSCMGDQLAGEDINCEFIEPISIDDLADSVLRGLKDSGDTTKARVVVAPFTDINEDKFSEFSDHFKRILIAKLSSSTHLDVLESCPIESPMISDVPREVALEYAQKCDAQHVLMGTYQSEGNNENMRYIFRSILRRVSDGGSIATSRATIRASILHREEKNLDPKCDLKYWDWRCPWPPWNYLVPGLGMIQEGPKGEGWLLAGTTLATALGLVISLDVRSSALAKRNVSLSEPQDTFFDKRARQASYAAIGFGVALGTSYLINVLWLEAKR